MKRDRPQTTSMWIVTAKSEAFNFFDSLRFTYFSGVKDSTATEKYESPFLHRTFDIPVARSYDPITLRAPYVSKSHSDVLRVWNSYSNTPMQIRVEPIVGCHTSGEETSLGYAIDLSGVIWIGCEVPSVDREDNKISTLELKFSFVSATDIEL